MREIKYRGLVVEPLVSGDKWITADGEYHEVYINRAEKSAYINGHEVDYESVGQSTGLKDKVGVSIFEGDLFKHPMGIIAEIIYADEFAAFLAKYKLGESYRRDLLDPLIVSQCEVVGNKFENPELLEATA